MKYVNYINQISKEIRRQALKTIERDVIESLCEGKTYLQIASQLKYDDGYIGQLARELFGLIGQKHKVKVNRLNFVIVLDSVMGGELENDFYDCHGIKPDSVFESNVLKFKQDEILISVSTFWKFNPTNKCLILKTKNPILLDLEELETGDRFQILLNLTKRNQVSGDALLELLKILDNYYNKEVPDNTIETTHQQ